MGRQAMKLMGLLPQNTLSKWAGKAMRSKRSKRAIPLFIKAYGIDSNLAEKPLHEYNHLNEFFTRRLHPEAFAVDRNQETVISPVNGTVSEYGTISEGRLLQAKNATYTLEGLLGGTEEAKVYENGTYITIYLAPSDYHRVHVPIEGEITSYRYIPGRLFPVNPQAVRHVDNLFSRNERLVTHLDTAHGRCAVVQVGAFLVGSAQVEYAEVKTNLGLKTFSERLEYPIHKEKGQGLGWFEFGSTVVLLLEGDGWALREGLESGQKVTMGQVLYEKE